jgi:putative ABC transport system permease protein
MVVGLVALTVALLVGAALLGRSLIELIRVHPGFQPKLALTFQVGLPEGIWREQGRQAAFFEELLSRLRQHPSVVHAGAASTLPLHRVGLRGSFGIEGRPRPTRPQEWPVASKVAISPGYLEAVGTRVIRGRSFTEADSATSPLVALIDEVTARTYFVAEDPIGRRIEFARRLYTVVGLVESIKQKSVTLPAETTIYFAAAQLSPIMAFNRFTGGVGVRTTGDPLDLVPFIRSAVREVDPASPVYNVMRLDDRLDATFAEPRFYSLALGMFAALVLTTSILGVYGVLSYAVERRRMEFGVRRALGATERDVAGLVLRQALILIIVGLLGGLALAAAGVRMLSTLLFGVEPLDAATFAMSGAFILATGLAAAWQPARQALAIDPARALRAD